MHLENPPHANDEVKPWSSAWLSVCLLAELLGAYIHGPAQVSQSLQLLEMSKFILYEMWVSGFVSAHISPDVSGSHLSGMYLKFCPMPKSQSFKNISILNNSWIFLKFPLKHCLSLFILFQWFLLSNQGEHYLSHNSIIQCPISENDQDLVKSQVSSEWKTMKLNYLTIIRDIPQSLVSAMCLKNVFGPLYCYRLFIHMQLCMCLFASLKNLSSAGQHILFNGL